MGLVAMMIALGAGLAALDLSLFATIPARAFGIHNVLASGVGLALASVSWRLLMSGAQNRPVLLLNILFGIGMIVIHLLKLAWGGCV
jgi:hypothetical protein